MLTKAEKIKILDETVEYYSKNPRSVYEEDNSCMYLHEDKVCAFSRLCNEEQRKILHNEWEGRGVNNKMLSQLGLDVADGTFYSQIQNLHDAELYWQSRRGIGVGLSKEGVGKYADILHFINTDKI